MNLSPHQVYEHVALQHLAIFQYKCDFCQTKVKIKRHLIEHLLAEHGVNPGEGVKGEGLEVVEEVEGVEGVEQRTELVLAEAEDGQYSVVSEQVEEVKAEEEVAITLQVPVEELVQEVGEEEAATSLLESTAEFAYSEHGMRLELGPSGSKKVFVGSATHPLLRYDWSSSQGFVSTLRLDLI